MNKLILQAGQLIDVVNYNDNQYFTLVVSEDLPLATAIYKEDTSIEVYVQAMDNVTVYTFMYNVLSWIVLLLYLLIQLNH